ncbi:hypothetical protein MRB53_026061 [Persea americana]|uniref:Uncharacterized protein n=1 Tax=Persea americana TaxID=3435 RepID=A0ACC2LH96_PERAE|nr:hypothetical protein MRB53_026061 [Persea americana]
MASQHTQGHPRNSSINTGLCSFITIEITRQKKEKMASECMGKSVWPELLGVAGEVAKRTIEEENSLVTAQIVTEGTIVITDFRCDRVWVWVDETAGIVTRVPKIG